MKYPNLESAIASRGIKKKAIAQSLKISGRSLYNKLHGQAPVTWSEACLIQKHFFPDLDKDTLFHENNEPPKAG